MLSRRHVLLGAPVMLASAVGRGKAEETKPMHLVLLGDSVFDNAAYVGGAPDVIAQVRERLPSGAQATLVAVDGNVIADIPRQLARMPADATHVVVSIGGNDALGHSGVLGARSISVTDSLLQLTAIKDRFRSDYAGMLQGVLRLRLPTAVCTIYDVRYPDPVQRHVVITALALINDGILREAALRGVPVLDLRAICSEDADFANPIEPSERGGAKIADAIARLVRSGFGDGARLLVR